MTTYKEKERVYHQRRDDDPDGLYEGYGEIVEGGSVMAKVCFDSTGKVNTVYVRDLIPEEQAKKEGANLT